MKSTKNNPHPPSLFHILTIFLKKLILKIVMNSIFKSQKGNIIIWLLKAFGILLLAIAILSVITAVIKHS